jgi:hypothetical protein
MMEELNQNESKPAYNNIFSKGYYGLYDFTDGKEWKTFVLWAMVVGGLLGVISYFGGTTKDKVNNEIINKLNDFDIAYRYYRGVIKDSKDNIITTASCTLKYTDSEGKSFSQKNDTTDMTGCYLFKIPMNSKELILNVSKNPSDKIGLQQSIDETVTDVPQIIIYP